MLAQTAIFTHRVSPTVAFAGLGRKSFSPQKREWLLKSIGIGNGNLQGRTNHRHVLDVQGKIAVENNEKVAYLQRDLPHIAFVEELIDPKGLNGLNATQTGEETFGVSLFWKYVRSGQTLAELHVHYEDQPEYRLEMVENPAAHLNWRVEKMRLKEPSPYKGEGETAELIYNDFLTLRGIAAAIFEYRLGNRSGSIGRSIRTASPPTHARKSSMTPTTPTICSTSYARSKRWSRSASRRPKSSGNCQAKSFSRYRRALGDGLSRTSGRVNISSSGMT